MGELGKCLLLWSLDHLFQLWYGIEPVVSTAYRKLSFMSHCKAALYLLPHHKQRCFILQHSPCKTSDLLICRLKMAFRISKRDFTAVIYPQGPAFVSIRFDICHCFHIWCIQSFLCSTDIFPISNFSLSYVQFSLIFRWLWHDVPPLPPQRSALFLSSTNFLLVFFQCSTWILTYSFIIWMFTMPLRFISEDIDALQWLRV